MFGNRYSQHSFAQIPSVNIARSSFDRSFTAKDTFEFDDLVPVFVDEMLPGDTANLTMRTFMRLTASALKVPIMDRMMVDFFFFFVPSRLVWSNWEKFNGAQDNPGDSTDFMLPFIDAPLVGGFPVGSIYDHYGLPTGINSLRVNNALPLRCYNLIWNEWFRDQNLQDSVDVPKDDGPDTYADYVLLKRGKRHDYFTSALPWPQKGPSVELPLAGTAPVVGNGTTPTVAPFATPASIRSLQVTNVSGNSVMGYSGANFTPQNAIFGVVTGLDADLSSATAATVNQLREAFMMQSLFELDARGGTRYVEILRAHFNVVSPDFRLQRPEYLGGGEIEINSHPVANSTGTEDAPQGQLTAFATSSTKDRNVGFTKSFVEHGYVIGMACARADITYQQGLTRMWNRSTRYDFFWPKLQELGEQAILNKEIYATGSSGPDSEVFGYQERYAEYRYMPSQIKGQFRSTYAQSLDAWHMAQEFASTPVLNEEFIVQNTPIERALAVTDGPNILADFWFQYRHARPMMAYSVPATLGRF